MSLLPAVRTREDCYAWLPFKEVESELFAAFFGATAMLKHLDYGLECSVSHAEDGIEGHGLIEGTVIDSFDGQPWVGREHFLESMIWFTVLRLRALGERHGVFLCPGGADTLGYLPPGASTAIEALEHPYWKKWVGCKVTTITDEEIKAMPAKDRKQLEAAIRAGRSGKSVTLKKRTPASATNTSGAMTINKRSIDDGTDCKS